MNVLWLNAGLLLPLDKGGKLRLAPHAPACRRHHISYLSSRIPAQADLDGMLEVCRSLENQAAIRRRERGVRRRRAFPNRFYASRNRSAAYAARMDCSPEAVRCDRVRLPLPLVNLPEGPRVRRSSSHNVKPR